MASMKNIEVYVSGLFILVGGVIFWQALLLPYSSEFGPGCGLLPLWVSGILIVLCILNLMVAIKNNNTNFNDILPKGTSLKNVLACVGGYVLFTIAVPYAGFSFSSIVMLFILFSRGYKWRLALVWSVAVTVAMFIIFNWILGVPLPLNEYGW
jgi:putative tricarboxylic transport membrane protein